MICMYILYDGRRKCRYNNLAFMSDAFLHGRCFFKKHAILFPEYFASTHHKKQKKPKGKRKKEKNERFPASSTPAERTNRKILTIEQMYAYLS